MKYAFLAFLEILLFFYLAESFYMTSMTFSHVVYKEIFLFYYLETLIEDCSSPILCFVIFLNACFLFFLLSWVSQKKAAKRIA